MNSTGLGVGVLPLFIQALLYPNPEGSVTLLANPGFTLPGPRTATSGPRACGDALKVSLKANQIQR